jgi:hypothetical protein
MVRLSPAKTRRCLAKPIDASERMAASFPIVTRSYEPVADLDELLRHIFALLSLPPTEE